LTVVAMKWFAQDNFREFPGQAGFHVAVCLRFRAASWPLRSHTGGRCGSLRVRRWMSELSKRPQDRFGSRSTWARGRQGGGQQDGGIFAATGSSFRRAGSARADAHGKGRRSGAG